MAKTLNINTATAYKWLAKKQCIAKKKGGSLSKKSPEVINAITSAIENNASITLEEIKNMVFSKFNLKVCKSTIRNWLHLELFSLKNVRPTMNRPENKLKRS